MDVVEALAAIDEHLEWRAPVDDRHREDVTRLRAALVDSPVGVALAPIAGERTALAAALFYALPLADFAALPGPVATLAAVLADTARLPQDLRAEVDRLREQVTTMRSSAL